MHGSDAVELFLLGREEGMTIREAAELAGVPAGTGKVSLRGDCTVIQTTVPGQA